MPLSKRRYSLSEIKASYGDQTAYDEKFNSWPVYIMFRPMSFPISWVCVNAGISANAITALSLIVTLSFPFVAAYGWSLNAYALAVLMLIMQVLDCVDGAIARTTGTSSTRGQYFDFLTDTIYRLLAYLSVGIVTSHHSIGWLADHALVISVSAAWLCTASRMLRDYAKQLMGAGVSQVFPKKHKSNGWLDYIVFVFSSLDYALPFALIICAYFGGLPWLVCWLIVYAVLEFGYCQFSIWQKTK